MVEQESAREIQESLLFWQALLKTAGRNEVIKQGLNNRPHLEGTPPHGFGKRLIPLKATVSCGFEKCLGRCPEECGAEPLG